MTNTTERKQHFPSALKQTPGPWHLDDKGDLRGPSNDRIFFRGANASLIAAAPELLEACRAMIATFHDHPDRDEVSLSLARAAIAKAEGR